MSRLKSFLVLGLIVALIGGLYVWQYVASLHQVSVNITEGLRVNIYQVVEGVAQKSSSSATGSIKLSLQNGDYCAKPNDPNYDQTPVCFEVSGKDVSVVVNPNYSSNYLKSLLPVEINAINSIITKTYSAVIDNFNLKTGSLFGHGEWYGGTLTQKTQYASDQGDVYRVLLKKTTAGTWVVVAYPQIVLSKYDYPTVPYNILDSVNRLTGVQG